MSITVSNLRSLVFKKYSEALSNGAVKFTETSCILKKERDVSYQIRFAPQLLKKPTNLHNNTTTTTPTPNTKKPDPFANPDEKLYISPIGSRHYTVLNKFPVQPRHFILATTLFERQDDRMTVSDWDAVASVLRAWYEAGDGGLETLYGFFNCGPLSGASQAHRHIQFLPLGGGYGLWPAEVVDGHINSGGGGGGQHPAIPFVHRVARLPPMAELCGDVLCGIYTKLLESIGTPLSYNLGFTKDFLAICPRTASEAFPVPRGTKSGVVIDGVEIDVPGVGLNGTMLAGMCLVKTEVESDALVNGEDAVRRVMAEVGVAVGDGRGHL